MKLIGLIVICIILAVVIFSYVKADETQQNNNSIVLIKVKYNSYGINCFGGKLKIRNVATNKLYESKSKTGFNSFVMITNVPKGTYAVEELQIISRPNTLIIREKPYFTLLNIDESKIYYLGNYTTKKIPPLLELHFQIAKTKIDEEEKIYKQVKKDSESWLKFKIDYQQQLFKSDTIQVEIKNHL